MVRKKLALAIATIGALQANVVNALGMGDFSLNSALNQPLNAEIRLLNTLDLDNSQVLIKLAGSQDFSKAGVSRDFFLTNLKFSVELDGSGNGIIKVTTREPVVEPYLNFLVEAHWPSGRLLREYTVLLDLPVFGEGESQPVSAASSMGEVTKLTSEPVRSTAAIATTRPSVRAEAPRQSLSDGEMKAGEKYRVKHDDTLWEIAVKSRPAQSVSVQQTMVGIQVLNPEAFINGNINRLKAGSVLRLPREDQISLSNRQAIGEVANQNRAWRQGDDSPSQEVQLDATVNADNVDNNSTAQSRLSISSNDNVLGDSINDGLGSDTGGSESLLNELDQTAENLEKSELEKSELESRLVNMEDKLSTLQRLLELKDDQLAALQSVAAEQSEAAELPLAQNESDVSEASGEDTDNIVTEPQVDADPKPKLAVPAKKDGIFDQLLENPLYAGGAGLLILAAAAVLIMRRRKTAQEADVDESLELLVDEELEGDVIINAGDEVEDQESAEELDSTDQLVAELEQQIAADNEEEAVRQIELEVSEQETAAVGEATIISEPVITKSQTESETNEPGTIESETGDAVAEADIYVAYGRYQQAIDLLRTAIANEPQRTDIQVKLLEVYIETRDKLGFQQQYVALQQLGDDLVIVQAKEMLSSIEGVSDWLDDLPSTLTDFSNDDMDADLIEGDDQAAADDLSADLATDEIDLDFDDVDLDADLDIDLDLGDIDLDSTSESDSLSLDDLELDLGVDLELDDDSGAGDKTVQYNIADLQDQLDTSVETKKEAATETDDSFDLDLDDDLDLESLEGADLKELEAEFGDLESATTEPPVEDDLALDDLSDELELTSVIDEELTGDNSETANNDNTVEYSLDEVTDEVSSADNTVTATFDAVVDDEADDDFDFLADTDEIATKLDLARAYIDMGDSEGARDILDEVMQDGSDEQKQEATGLLERMD